MREYEVVYILDPALTDAEVQHSIDRTTEIITRHSGAILRLQNMGKKTLAYKINKQSKGHYIAIDFCADSTTIGEIERVLKLDERVLRYLSIKLGDDVEVETRKKEIIEEAELLAKAAELNAQRERDARQPSPQNVEERA